MRVSGAFPDRLATARLILRRLDEPDRALWVRLHRDPVLHRHAPHAIAPSDAAASERFDGSLAHWQDHGFGFQVIERDGVGIGVGGLRTGREGELNLYYRISADHHGMGYAREAARAWVAAGVEWLEDPVTAVAAAHNTASLRTAEAAGLTRIGRRQLAGDPVELGPAVLLRAPAVEVVRESGFVATARAEVLDLWVGVTEDGGAVGFVPGDPRSVHEEALAAHESQMRAGAAVAVLQRCPATGALLSIGWLVGEESPRHAHRATAYRIMSDPAHRGRNLGRLQVAAMHRVARADGVEMVLLTVRGGLGLEEFYAGCGYAEVGRIPGGIRVAPGDDRDDVLMMRRL